jgi:DNA-directed RNA polymerase subunit RPC12/RpoP
MSATIDESEVHTSDKVICARCGSRILQKNLNSHMKTQKCLNGGVVVKKKDAPVPQANVVVSIDALGNTKYQDKDKLEKLKSSKNEANEDDIPFEDYVEDELDEIQQKLDVIIKLITGDDLGSIEEEKDE